MQPVKGMERRSFSTEKTARVRDLMDLLPKPLPGYHWIHCHKSRQFLMVKTDKGTVK